MILFRTDGSQQIGSGHIMRCLSLADAFQDMGQAVIFVTAGDRFQAAVQKQGYECIVLHTEYDRMEDELPKFLPLLQKLRPGCVLLEQPAGHVIYHVILGAMNQDISEIERISAGCPRILLHRNVTDMRSLMLSCDAAISAGGTTLFELCACGLPTVSYVLADNQIMNAASFEEAGLMLSAGGVDERFARRIFEQLNALLQNWRLRQQMAERMQTLVDGNGAIRLTKAILEFIATKDRETSD